MIRTIYPWEYSKLFGGHWPMYPTPEATPEECRAELEREEPRATVRRYTVSFEKGYNDRLLRRFWTVAELVAYMRRYGWCTTDIRVIWEHDWEFNQEVPTWVVVARDENYGYRKRWYFATESQADAFSLTLPSQFKVLDIHETTRRVRFAVPYGNTVRVPFNTR